MRLGDLIGPLASEADLRLVRGDASSLRVCDLTEDSRTVVPGSMFLARRGATSDGRRYIQDAVREGACAVVVEEGEGFDPTGVPEEAALILTRDAPLAAALLAERFYGEPSSALAVAGVTGSNGKTTVAHLIHRALNHARLHDRDRAPRCGLIGTVEVDDGAERAPAEMTTPPAIEISRTLGVMVESGCGAVAMEVSSHALHQRRVAGVRFDVGVFTNLSGDHMDYHGTMEAYADAKAMLFECLPRDGLAVVNIDDPAHARMLRDCPARALRCSTAPGADARAELVSADLDGVSTRLTGPWGEMLVRAPLFGAHNSMNLLQAAAAAWALAERAGCAPTPGALAGALSAAGAPAGRLELVSDRTDDVRVLVDYAHTDDALRRTLGAVRDAMASGSTEGAGALWVVFGAGGDRDRAKRPRMGRAAADLADRVIVTSDNPRREAPSAIVGEILAGMTSEERERAEVHIDRARAIRFAVTGAAPGDVVVIAGKGHERDQVSADAAGNLVSVPFDDRAESRAALRERRGGGARR